MAVVVVAMAALAVTSVGPVAITIAVRMAIAITAIMAITTITTRVVSTRGITSRSLGGASSGAALTATIALTLAKLRRRRGPPVRGLLREQGLEGPVSLVGSEILLKHGHHLVERATRRLTFSILLLIGLGHREEEVLTPLCLVCLGDGRTEPSSAEVAFEFEASLMPGVDGHAKRLLGSSQPANHLVSQVFHARYLLKVVTHAFHEDVKCAILFRAVILSLLGMTVCQMV